MKIEIMIKPGHKLYKVNIDDGEIIQVDTAGNTSRFYIADYIKGELYASALNIKNAKRKFERMVQYIVDKYQ